MSAATEPLIFEALPMRRRNLVPVQGNQYRVIPKSGETKQIMADTAYEAFKLSGFSTAVRIERVTAIEHVILEKQKFADENGMPFDAGTAFADVTPEGDDALSRLKRRKNPVISADELDTLMRSLREMAVHAPADIHAELANALVPSVSDAGESVPASGTEIHGDGFDEIIPAAHSAKPAPARQAEPADVQSSAPAENASAAPEPLPVPERELSQDEIEKLLNGDS